EQTHPPAQLWRRISRGDRFGIATPADHEEARAGQARPHPPDGLQQVVDALLPGEAPNGTDGELVGPEAELCALSGCLRARPSEAGELHALPEDVHLLGRPEALRRVPARRPVRDDDARVDRPPGEAIDPARPLELVGRTQEEDDAAARAGDAPEGRHARRLLALDADDVGLLGA